MRKIAYILLGLLTLLILLGIGGIRYFNNMWFEEVPLHLKYTFEEKPMDFYWTSHTYGNHHEPHLAMMLPVQLEGIPHRFYLQYDTGAQTSYLHGNTLLSIEEALGIQIERKILDGSHFVQALDFKISDNPIHAEMIQFLPPENDYAKPFNIQDTIRRIKLGTIGADFLVDRVTTIDFKNQLIHIYHQLPESLQQSAKFVPFDFSGRRFMLPSKIAGQTTELYYDSGSSSYGLITTKNRFNKYTDPNTPELNLESSRHGESLSVHHKPSDMPLFIGGTAIPIERVSYVDMYTSLQPLITPFTRIGGWLGNEPFIDHMLIFDLTSNSQFAVVESDKLIEDN